MGRESLFGERIEHRCRLNREAVKSKLIRSGDTLARGVFKKTPPPLFFSAR
jgi:hypothetical protein